MNFPSQFLEFEQSINSLISSGFLLSFRPPFSSFFLCSSASCFSPTYHQERFIISGQMTSKRSPLMKSSQWFYKGKFRGLRRGMEADEYQPQPLHLETRVYHVRHTFLADCFRDSRDPKRFQIKRGYILENVLNGVVHCRSNRIRKPRNEPRQSLIFVVFGIRN